MQEGTPSGGIPQGNEAEVLRRELERRLVILEDANEEEFGRFTAFDWTICVLFFVILPILAAWWYA